MLSGEDGQRLDERLHQIAGWLRALGDERSKSVLRSVAVGHLAEPDSLGMLYDQVVRMRARSEPAPAEATGTAEPMPSVDAAASVADDEGPDSEPPAGFRRDASRLPRTVLYLHLDRKSGTWSMDEAGAITRAEAQEIVGHSQVTIQPVIDLAAHLAYTGYVAPPRLREQTALQNAGVCTFPSCNRPARDADYGHITDHADGGATDSRNGHRLCGYHHRAKTFTDWTVLSPAPEFGCGSRPPDVRTW